MEQGFIIASELDRSSLLYLKYNKDDNIYFLKLLPEVREWLQIFCYLKKSRGNSWEFMR